MPRPIWSGAISFGLVNVPVKLLTAVRKHDVRFHQLHRADGARIQQRRICSAEGSEVAYEDVVKGYELSPGRYVMIEADELETLNPRATHTIDIESFAALEEIDPIYYSSSYYLVPDKRGEKAYRLLVDAMNDSQRVGIAKFVLRSKQYLCALRPLGQALVLSTMNFADEIVDEDDIGELPGPEVTATDQELKMAGQLIDTLVEKFDPKRFEDTYQQSLLEVIERKAEGEEVVAEPEAEEPTPVVDLMAALEASLHDGGARAEMGRESERVKDEPRTTAKKAPARKAPAKKASRRKAS